MAKIVKNNFRSFSLILILILISISSFLVFKIFSARAQEQIKVIPESFTCDPSCGEAGPPVGEAGWQNPQAVFFQDLGSQASFEEFNWENSAYSETSGNTTTTTQFNKTSFFVKLWLNQLKSLFNFEARAESSVCKPGTNRPCGTEVGECQIGVQICEYGIWGECMGAKMPTSEICDEVDNDCDGQVDEEEVCGFLKTPSFCQIGTNRPCGTEVGECQIGVQICEYGIWGECIGGKMPSLELCDSIDNDCDGEIDEDRVCEIIQLSQKGKVLILSGFNVSLPENTKIKFAQLRLSLAGKGKTGDKLAVDYLYQNTWQSLAIFDLENEISNALNGGYFLYGLPVFQEPEELEKLKIRFTYLSENRSPTGSSVFLDAVWLEVETEEAEKEEVRVSDYYGEKFSLKSIKRDPPAGEASWRRDEVPEFEITEVPKGFLEKIISIFQIKTVEAVLINPQGQESQEEIIIQDNKIIISQPDKRSFRPGLYKLKVKIVEGGEKFILEEEFRWGVLAINTNKSIYLPNETAYIQMAILNNRGHTICDADLKLEIIPPYGSATSVNVEKSGECKGNNVTDIPDYFANYQVEEMGIYQIKLTNLDNGYEIIDSFEVRESVPFDVERVGPTRIYPLATYPITLLIIANEDFSGVIEERVPVSFEISQPVHSQKYQSINEEEDTKVIEWEVSLATGEQIQLGYYFDAPDISPYLYLLGPLKIGDFQEVRQWQVASDVPAADFNVQRRCEKPAAGTGTVTLTAGTDYTAPANNNYAFIRIASARLSGMGNTVGGGTLEADDWTWYISDPDFAGGSVAFTRAGTTNSQRFCWEIIEYVGAASGANEMIVRGVDTATYGTSDTTKDGSSVSGISDDNDVAVFITGQNSVETQDQDEVGAGLNTSEWVSASDVPRFTRGFTGGDANSISYAVVEFTGSNWAVERKEHTFSAVGATETETITDVGDVSRAFFHGQFRLDAEEGLDDNGAKMWLSATNEVSFYINAGADDPGSSHHAVVWIVRNSDTTSETKMNVQHISGSRATGDTSEGANNEEDEWTETITTVDDTAQTSIMGETNESAGSYTAFPRGWISLYLNATDGVKLYQSDDGQPQNYCFQVVEWPKTATAGNNKPTIVENSVVFHDNLSITLNEWDGSSGTTIVTTTFMVQDMDGWAEISTTTIIAYSTTLKDEQSCASSSQGCYQGDPWFPEGPGANDGTCAMGDNTTYTATFWCTTSLHFFATSTDIGSENENYWWEVFASTSDINYDYSSSTNATNTDQSVEVNTLQALNLSTTSITYPTIGAGSNSANEWVTTTATTTGNVAIDIHFEGGSMTKNDDASYHIGAYCQKFTTSSALIWSTVDSDTATPIRLPTTTDEGIYASTHDVTMARPTTTPPGPTTADDIFWGIGIPEGQAIGTYSSTTNLTATSTIIDP